MSASGSAEEELALLQILQRRGVLVSVRRPLAGHRRAVARLVVEALNRCDDLVDVFLSVAAEREQEDRRVPVLRDEASLLAVRDDACRTRCAELGRKCSDSRTCRRTANVAALGSHDDHLADRLAGLGLLRKGLVEDPVGLLATRSSW